MSNPIHAHDLHTSHNKVREITAYDGGLKVYNPTLVDIDEGITNLESYLDNVETLLTLDRTQDLAGVNLRTGGPMADNFSHVIDLTAHRSVRIYGSINEGSLTITATCADNIGNANFWSPFAEVTNTGTFNLYYDDAPRYLKIQNLSGSQITTCFLEYMRNK
jgi:hypothetical protein